MTLLICRMILVIAMIAIAMFLIQAFFTELELFNKNLAESARLAVSSIAFFYSAHMQLTWKPTTSL